MARHRSPRGRRASRTLPFPLVGTPGGTSGDRRLPVRGSTARGLAVPAPVARGAGVATVVAVAGGAVAAFGTTAVTSTPADPAASANPSVLALAAERPGGSAPAPVPTPVGGAIARMTVPLPGQAQERPAEPAVMDPAQLSGAVQRAQGEARRLAEQARAKSDERRAAAARPTQAGDSEEADDEERRTAERARRAGRAADTGSAGNCGLDTGGLGPVRAHVRTAANVLGCEFGRPDVLGVAGRGGPSDHPEGLALDFMVDRVTGDALADCALRHREELGVSYVIWRQRIDTGSGFKPMPDRGGPTANHFDHVHISFRSGAGNGAPFSC